MQGSNKNKNSKNNYNDEDNENNRIKNLSNSSDTRLNIISNYEDFSDHCPEQNRQVSRKDVKGSDQSNESIIRYHKKIVLTDEEKDLRCESRTPYKPYVILNKIYPGKVYNDLLRHESFGMHHKNSFNNKEGESFDVIKEDIVVSTGEEQEEKAIALRSMFPRRLHYLDNVVYMAPKRNSFGGRSSSLPTSAPLVNLNDLARLQGMHERAKQKNTIWGNRKSIGKSLFYRLAKKLTPTNDNKESDEDFKNGTFGGRANEEEHIQGTYKNSSWKVLERRGSALPGIIEGKTKSFRMGQIFRGSLASGRDNLLHQAIVNKDVDMLEKLLVHDIYVEEVNYLQPPGVTMFHQACGYGDYRVVQLLLEKGADVHLLTWAKLSPLKIAVMFGHYEIAELLLDSGADFKDVQNGFQDLDFN